MTNLNHFSTSPPSTPLVPRPPPTWRLASSLLLIGLGSAFLLATRQIHADNWWTIFILLTAIGLLVGGWPGLFSKYVVLQLLARASLSAGLVVLSVGLLFLFRVDWSTGWTVMLIVCGVMLSLNAITRWPAGSVRHAWASLLGWAGLTTALLGITFLADQMGVINLELLSGGTRWWSAFILLPAVGATGQGLGLWALRGRSAGALSLLAWGLVLGVAATTEFLGLSQRWSPPVALIITGLALLLPSLWEK